MAALRIGVLVVGGGMSGLAAALFLRQQGVDCLVVDRNTSVSQLLRSTHVSPRTMELFRTLGIEEDVFGVADRFVLGKHWCDPDLPPRHLPRAILRAGALADIVNDDALVMAEGENDFADISPTEAVWCGQDKIEPIMLAEARRRGARIRFGTDFVSFQQDADGVTAVLRDRATGEETTVRADYLIGADGAHGLVRKELGIERRGHGTLGYVLNVLFKADLDTPLAGRRFMILYLNNRYAPGMLFKLDDDRWIYGIFGDPRRLDPERISEEECVGYVRAATGIKDLVVDVQTTMGWWIGHGVADTYRAGRVFLVGDACHVMPPTGGFGANVGVQDAGNLAWKIGAVLHGWADDALLDTYEAERRPVGVETVEQAWMRHMRWSNPGDEASGDEREQTIVTTAYRYTSAAIAGEPFPEAFGHELVIDGAPGMRVPHAWLDEGVRVSTVDLTGEDFLLFGDERWTEAAEQVACGRGVPLRTYPASAQFRAVAGIGTDGALLVRPDGFVAWRATGSTPDPRAEFAEVLSTITASRSS
ncbi:FAD-dependent monooxygenase [Lentzea terrae]|uniref:FAD-dependent monooxygenase n=1 Tax=Lentzea terrae TaxID=2200761 RepID=UPI000DD3AD9C|nr:FAD-dependent monooxygenase [Lentzea terrae]